MNINSIKYINNINQTTRLVETSNGVSYLEFKPFAKLDFIRHGFSTRLGGVSKGIYSSMNLSYTRDDDERLVRSNFELMADALQTKTDNMVYAMQTHTANVMKVGKEEGGMGVTCERNFSDIDGLITNESGVCLVTSYADCVPLYFVDPVNRCIGLSHSGWRGTVGRIAANTVDMMTKEYNTNPCDVIAFIGPSICEDCYEVSRDVADIFIQNYTLVQTNNLLKKNNNGKYQLNLHQANVYNMIEAGLEQENIYVTDICTCCNPQLLFSHRATIGKRGGLCGFMELI